MQVQRVDAVVTVHVEVQPHLGAPLLARRAVRRGLREHYNDNVMQCSKYSATSLLIIMTFYNYTTVT